MRLVAFFVYLCTLLFGGNGQAYAGIHHASMPHAAVYHQKTAAVKKLVGVHRSRIRFHSPRPGSDIESLFTVDIDNNEDDDDAGNSYAKKCPVPVTWNATVTYPHVLYYRRYSYKSPASVWVRPSHIYILQRTLRI